MMRYALLFVLGFGVALCGVPLPPFGYPYGWGRASSRVARVGVGVNNLLLENGGNLLLEQGGVVKLEN